MSLLQAYVEARTMEGNAFVVAMWRHAKGLNLQSSSDISCCLKGLVRLPSEWFADSEFSVLCVSLYVVQADRLHEESNRLLIDYRTGKTGLRGKPALPKKPEGQQLGADGQAAAPAENPPPPRAAAVRARYGMPKAGRGRVRGRGGLDDDLAPRRAAKLRTQYNINDFSTVVDGENPRTTFRPAARKELGQWRGLAGGSSAEGQAFGAGRALLRCPMGNINNLPLELYLGSFARFVAGAGPKVAALARQMMGGMLEGLVPDAYVPPPPAPTPDPAAAAAVGALPGAVQLQIQQQQPLPGGGAVGVASSVGQAALGRQQLPLALQQMLMGGGMGGVPAGLPPVPGAGLNQLPPPAAPMGAVPGISPAAANGVQDARGGMFAPNQQLEQQQQQVGIGAPLPAAAVAAPRGHPAVVSMAPPSLPLSSMPGGAPPKPLATSAPAGVLDLTGDSSSGPSWAVEGVEPGLSMGSAAKAPGVAAAPASASAAGGYNGVGGLEMAGGGFGGGGLAGAGGMVAAAGGHVVVSTGMVAPMLQQQPQQQQLGLQVSAGWQVGEQQQLGILQHTSLPQQQQWNPAAQPMRQPPQLQGLMLGSKQQEYDKAGVAGVPVGMKAYNPAAAVGTYQAVNHGDIMLSGTSVPLASGLPPQTWPAASGGGQLWPGQQG
jgi:hypothetical protein